MLDTIASAIADIRAGKVVIVVDDEDRENEGDFICAAACATPEIINFMATHGRGLVCASLPEARCEALGLDLMVGHNTALHELKVAFEGLDFFEQLPLGVVAIGASAHDQVPVLAPQRNFTAV